PRRLRVLDRRGADRDLDHPDRRLRREQLQGARVMTAAAVPRAAAVPVVRRKPLRPGRVGLHVFLAVTAIVWLFPVGWAVYNSFRPYSDTAKYGYVSFAHTLSLSNYRNAWTQGQIPLHFWDTMIVTIPAIVLILFFASCVAFVVSRFSFWFNVPLLVFFMAANLLPQQVIITPLYELYLRIPLPGWLSDTGLMYDSFLGLIAVNVAFQTGFCTFVLSNYMKTIPSSLSEAARVGGAGDARVHLDLQRLPLGDRVHELGRQAADHLVAPEPDRHLLHRQQPDLG